MLGQRHRRGALFKGPLRNVDLVPFPCDLELIGSHFLFSGLNHALLADEIRTF